jgi:hypothetical protein
VLRHTEEASATYKLHGRERWGRISDGVLETAVSVRDSHETGFSMSRSRKKVSTPSLARVHTSEILKYATSDIRITVPSLRHFGPQKFRENFVDTIYGYLSFGVVRLIGLIETLLYTDRAILSTLQAYSLYSAPRNRQASDRSRCRLKPHQMHELLMLLPN